MQNLYHHSLGPEPFPVETKLLTALTKGWTCHNKDEVYLKLLHRPMIQQKFDSEAMLHEYNQYSEDVDNFRIQKKPNTQFLFLLFLLYSSILYLLECKSFPYLAVYKMMKKSEFSKTKSGAFEDHSTLSSMCAERRCTLRGVKDSILPLISETLEDISLLPGLIYTLDCFLFAFSKLLIEIASKNTKIHNNSGRKYLELQHGQAKLRNICV